MLSYVNISEKKINQYVSWNVLKFWFVEHLTLYNMQLIICTSWKISFFFFLTKDLRSNSFKFHFCLIIISFMQYKFFIKCVYIFFIFFCCIRLFFYNNNKNILLKLVYFLHEEKIFLVSQWLECNKNISYWLLILQMPYFWTGLSYNVIPNCDIFIGYSVRISTL